MIVTQDFYVGFREINKDLTIKNSTILANFVDVAGVHSASVGDVFGESPVRWLLTGYKVRVLKRPRHGEKVKVSTWATEIKNIKSSREFEVRSESGEILIQALSSWVSYNVETRRPEKVRQELIDAYGVEPNKSNFVNEEISRIDEPHDVEFRKEQIIDWKFIDLNEHLNNSFYMDIAEHSLTNFDLCCDKVDYNNFEVVFKREIKEGTKIICQVRTDDSKTEVWFVDEETDVLHAKVTYFR